MVAYTLAHAAVYFCTATNHSPNTPLAVTPRSARSQALQVAREFAKSRYAREKEGILGGLVGKGRANLAERVGTGVLNSVAAHVWGMSHEARNNTQDASVLP